jgi:hypothetical protein
MTSFYLVMFALPLLIILAALYLANKKSGRDG